MHGMTRAALHKKLRYLSSVYIYPGPRARGVKRWQLIRLALHKRFRPSDLELRLPGGMVVLAAATMAADQATLHEIFVAEDYDADFRGATVIDFGAHKGYFGAYALSAGAASVISFEPERQNFTYLERAVNSFRSQQAAEWRAYPAAIGGHEGKARLIVSAYSWAHSLEGWPEEQSADGYEVDIVPAERALKLAGSMPGNRLIAKIDVEGAECTVVCATSSESWECVTEMFVEHHRIAPCTAEDIVARLSVAGLQLQSPIEPGATVQVLRFSRPTRAQASASRVARGI